MTEMKSNANLLDRTQEGEISQNSVDILKQNLLEISNGGKEILKRNLTDAISDFINDLDPNTIEKIYRELDSQ